jgi:hypothetical protein
MRLINRRPVFPAACFFVEKDKRYRLLLWKRSRYSGCKYRGVALWPPGMPLCGRNPAPTFLCLAKEKSPPERCKRKRWCRPNGPWPFGGKNGSVPRQCSGGFASLAPLSLLPGAPDIGGTEMVFRRKLLAWMPLSWVRVGWSCFSFRYRSSGCYRRSGGYRIRPYKRLRFRASLRSALPAVLNGTPRERGMGDIGRRGGFYIRPLPSQNTGSAQAEREGQCILE